MQAIVVSKTGGPEVLELTEVALPTPGPGYVRVQHEAIGVNFIDVYFREGIYPTSLPFIPGEEAAGVVEAVGDGVSDLEIGDRVAYARVQGSYAEYAVVPAERLVAVPADIDNVSAAAILLQGMTAHYLTTSTYAVGPNDLVVVLAAAGGLGQLLVRVAAHAGATVVAVTSSEYKAERVHTAGASHVVVHGGDPSIIVSEVDRISGGMGANVVYDSVGATTFDASLESLRPRGTLIVCGQASGPVPPLELARLRAGSKFLTRPVLGDYIASPAELRWRANDVFGLLRHGVVSLDINEPLPLSQATRAHELLASRDRTGKMLLMP